MSVTNEQFLTQYLDRIDYHGGTAPSEEVLTGLQRQHVYCVPFENLDLLKPSFTPNLDRDFLFDKIVKRRRGGVCYELNTSFYYLLGALGFSVEQISGAVRPGETMFAHVSTLVHLPEGDYIVDVGFADSFLPPLKVGASPAGYAEGCSFELLPEGDRVFQITRVCPGQEPKRMYSIGLTPRQKSDYFGQFTWASAMGNTVFSQYPICLAQNAQQRVLLRSGMLTVERGGRVVESRPIALGEETDRCLREYFDLP